MKFQWILFTLVASYSFAADSSSELSAFQNRFHRDRPVVAVVAQNRYTEITDFFVPYGLLSASGVAEVHGVSLEKGPIGGFPALTFEVPETIAEFDQRYPDGADYLIVPAVHEPGDPRLLNWVRSQAQKGGTIVGICDGVWVLAKAGLLESRSAVGHWNSIPELEKQFPKTVWLKNRRFWQDGPIVTTTGVTASVPVSMALVAAIGGPERAKKLADQSQITDLGSSHRTSAFSWTANEYGTLAGNWLAFWQRENVGIPIANGVDEVSLSLVADAWGRTFRAQALTVSESAVPVRTAGGLLIYPDRFGASKDFSRVSELPQQKGSALPGVLDQIRSSYGKDTENLVCRFVEYDRASVF